MKAIFLTLIMSIACPLWAQTTQPDPVIPEIKFDGIGFADVVEFLRDVSGRNIYVDWPVLTSVGRDRPVTVRIKDKKFSETLTEILKAASTATTQLKYAVDDENVIVISTEEGLRRLEQRRQAVRQARDSFEAMRTHLPEARFDAKLTETIKFIRGVSGAKILADWTAIEQGGVDASTFVSLRLKNVSAAEVLDLTLAQVRSPTGQLQMQVEAGQIRIVLVKPNQTAGTQPSR